MLKKKKQSMKNKEIDLEVALEIYNDTHQILTKTKEGENNKYYSIFPSSIAAKERITIILKGNGKIEALVTYQNESGSVEIKIDKTTNPFESKIIAIPIKDLVEQVKIDVSGENQLSGKLIIAESLVIVSMYNLYNFLNKLRDYITDRDQVVMGGSNLFDMIEYNKKRQIFNRRIQLKPYAIVYCKSTEEVQKVFTDAIKNNLPIRVRSGGHDHEGECSGTDVIVIDLSKIDHVSVDNDTNVARIGPGNCFTTLTSQLAANKGNPVMIPHGTCATVGISGFTFGGGWGPWTRSKGMCCELLVGATIILGDGSIKELSKDGDEQSRELLWALSGGGGFSYGIVTELKIQTFPLPQELIRFDIEWNSYDLKDKLKKIPTIKILKAWEKVINYYRSDDISFDKKSKNDQLIGTNLKISAINAPIDDNKFNADEVVHNVTMFGYWQGEKEQLDEFIAASFGEAKNNYKYTITGSGGIHSDKPYGSHMMSSDWDRVSFINVKRQLNNQPLLGRKEGEPFPPDFDSPAPHKITCRLVDADGLDANSELGHSALLRSLTSPLICNNNRELGLFSYVTLGAISGPYYQDKENVAKLNSAFPYKDKQYTIQYQTWWNEDLADKEKLQDNPVYERTNRALDWMQFARDFDIPNTSGSFISFKDSSIPTATYFAENYEKLIAIKLDHSIDPLNHFRSRKTIL